VSLADDIPPL